MLDEIFVVGNGVICLFQNLALFKNSIEELSIEFFIKVVRQKCYVFSLNPCFIFLIDLPPTARLSSGCSRIETRNNSFGIPVRMTNPPKGASSGNLWYFTYIKVNDTWRPIIYGAFPDLTNSKVGILDMHGEYKEAGKEPHPDRVELKLLEHHRN